MIGGLVHEQFVADHGVRDQHHEQAFLHDQRMRIAGVGDADDFRPFFADAVLERIMADAVFHQQLVDQLAEVDGRAAA